MPFKIRFHENNQSGLVAICDVCGCRVNGDEANILWLPKGKETHGDIHEYRIACKDEYTYAIDSSYGHQYSQELDTAVVYLLNNTRIDLKKATRNAEILARLSL